MFEVSFPTTADALARSFGGTIVGDADAQVTRISALDSAGAGALSFFANRKFASSLRQVRDAVLFTSAELVEADLPVTFIIVKDPQAAFAQVAKGMASKFPWEGISPLASIDPSVTLAPNVRIGPYAVIGANTKVGARTVIYPHAYVGAEVEIGADCQIHARVTLYDRVRLDDRVKIFPGAVIGSDGFGFFDGGGAYSEMPQVGTVVIESDVRIGALCTVDRATLGVTRIGAGTKIDNLVHIGHNCQIGKNVILCAQVGIAGSSTIEDGVIMAGQAGVAHGVHVGKGARIAGQAGTSSNLAAGETYFQSPAMPMKEALKVIKYSRKLPEIWKRLKDLESLLGEKTK